MRPEAEREVKRRIRRAISAAKLADRYAERASMLADSAFRILEHYEVFHGAFSPESRKADKVHKAHARLSDARGALGDAVHQLERAGASTAAPSRDHARRRRRS